MKIGYTDHGLERLNERGVLKKEVEEAMKKGKKGDAYDGLRKSEYKNKKGILVVIYNAPSPEEFLIITAYWE